MKALLAEIGAKIAVPNGTVLAVVTWGNIEAVGKITLIGVSIVYTVLQIYFLIRRELRK